MSHLHGETEDTVQDTSITIRICGVNFNGSAARSWAKEIFCTSASEEEQSVFSMPCVARADNTVNFTFHMHLPLCVRRRPSKPRERSVNPVFKLHLLEIISSPIYDFLDRAQRVPTLRNSTNISSHVPMIATVFSEALLSLHILYQAFSSALLSGFRFLKCVSHVAGFKPSDLA